MRLIKSMYHAENLYSWGSIASVIIEQKICFRKGLEILAEFTDPRYVIKKKIRKLRTPQIILLMWIPNYLSKFFSKNVWDYFTSMLWNKEFLLYSKILYFFMFIINFS